MDVLPFLVDEPGVGKHVWLATKGDGPRKFHEYLTGEFSMYVGKETRAKLNFDLAKQKAMKPTKWKENQAIQPWNSRK